eukprot:5611942-Prymnesium_polylepis.1
MTRPRPRVGVDGVPHHGRMVLTAPLIEIPATDAARVPRTARGGGAKSRAARGMVNIVYSSIVVHQKSVFLSLIHSIWNVVT